MLKCNIKTLIVGVIALLRRSTSAKGGGTERWTPADFFRLHQSVFSLLSLAELSIGVCAYV